MSVQNNSFYGLRKLIAAFVLATSAGSLQVTAGEQPVMLGFPVFVPNTIVAPIQKVNDGYGGGGEGVGVPPKANTSGTATSSPQSVGLALQNATRFCNSLPGTEYTVDCLAYEYWEIQKQLPESGEMADVKKVLANTSKQLRKLALDNQSSTKRPVRVTQGNRRLNRTLVPTESAKLPGLKREAAAIINNGATLIIRASGDSSRKRAQYQQIARSMQTGAIMLRSL